MERLKRLVATVEEPRQGEARRREASEKATEAKDAELKAALAKIAYLEKALQKRDRTIARERHNTLLEAQHLEESFSSKCFPLVLLLPGWDSGFLFLVASVLTCFSF